jgi:geranylgeranyl diphosphate synthase type II
MIRFQDALEIINRKIESIEYPQNQAGLYEPVAYLLALKGKKIRPALTLLACNLYQDDIDDAIYPALAWETFHNFTLMHDDVMDKADLRRGQPTVHKKWSENTAILSGDAMLILSYVFMAKSSHRDLEKLLALFSKTAAEICGGQQYDMEFESKMNISEPEYIEMIRLKTAVMIGACLKSGAIVGGAGEADQQHLYDFGINLGIAFQIKDDLLDVYGDPLVFGKKTGGDILCNKKTFLLVNALNKAEKTEKKELLSWFERKDEPDNKIEFFRNLYDELNISQQARDTITGYYKKALDAFQLVSISDEKKDILKTLAIDLMERES